MMAEGEAVVSAFLQGLSARVAAAVAGGELTLPPGIHKELEKLSRSIQTIVTLLKGAEVKQRKNKAVRAWLRDLKDIAYDADDILDLLLLKGYADDTFFSIEEQDDGGRSYKVSSCLFPSCSASSSPIPKIELEVKAIRKRLDKIARKRYILGLRADGGRSQLGITKRTDTRSPVETLALFGRDADKEKILELLLSVNQETDQMGPFVIPIFGRGGVGKTALAGSIYLDERVVKHFSRRIWVCASEVTDLDKLTRLIRNSVITDSSDEDENLEDFLDECRFLLVLDDIGNESVEWEKLCTDHLDSHETGSKIIVTTRSEKIATTMGMVGDYYCLRLSSLSASDSWMLFKECAFVSGNSGGHPELEAIGKKIVERLEGLPLAIRMIGGLSSSDLKPSHWNAIMETDAWKLRIDEDHVLPALIRLCYHHLSPHLQQLISYCSVFPKGHEFYKDELIQLWMAQSLLLPREGERMEDTGNDYFNDLLQGSFLLSFAHKFIMHNLVHDLARSISVDDCVRLIEPGEAPRIIKRTRHLLLCSDELRSPEFMDTAASNELRTFLFYRKNHLSFDHNALFMKLRFIRVLCLSNICFKELPDSIGNLKHLRYLDLADTQVKSLPESFCSLNNLQTLRLNHSVRLDLLEGMSNLIRLRHLEADPIYASRITQIGKLTALQELKQFCVEEKRGRRIEELKDLAELRGELYIWNLNNVTGREEAAMARLIDKEHLETLVLEWNWDIEWDGRPRGLDDEVLECLQPHPNLKRLKIRNHCGAKFPSWLKNQWLSNLTSIGIYGCLTWVFSALGKLCFLESLEINGKPVIHTRFTPLPRTVEELQSFGMQGWEEGEGWEDAEPFPNLQVLKIIKCFKLRSLPPLPPTLKELHIHKVGLTSLPRLWGCDGFSPSSLSSLCISHCDELTSLHEGLMQHNLRALESLTICKCPLLVSLPEEGLQSLVSLKSLVIEDCDGLKFISEHGGVEDVKLFPSLHVLKISQCYKLTRLPPLPPSLRELYIDRVGLGALPELWGSDGLSFSFLSSLNISGCPALTSLREGLLRCHFGAVECAESMPLPEDRMLKSLSIIDCEKLAFLAESGICHLPSSLVDLKMERCPGITNDSFLTGLANLTSLFLCSLPTLVSLGEHHLPSLVQLEISYCEKLTVLVFQAFPSLRRLKVVDCLEIVVPSLSLGGRPLPLQYLEIENSPALLFDTCELLRNLTSLQELHISRCNRPLVFSREVEEAFCSLTSLKQLYIDLCELESLPSELWRITSLEELYITDCHDILSLPEKGLPASLTMLVVDDCGLSPKHCKEGGAEWSKVAHIPFVQVKSGWDDFVKLWKPMKDRRRSNFLNVGCS